MKLDISMLRTSRQEPDERRNVRILIAGDEKVGKSSIISTLVSQHFSEKVPPVMHDVQIPAEDTANNIDVLIMDSSCMYMSHVYHSV